MASPMPFDFQTIRRLQKSCTEKPLSESFSPDDPLLSEVDRAKKSKFKLLDFLIRKADTNTALLHKALLLRSEVFIEKEEFTRAKEDVERAIILKPHYVKQYGALALAEIQLEQFGRAVVALRLGLLLDKTNPFLIRLLCAVRSDDLVYRDVCSLDGSDEKIRREQELAGYELVPPLPPLVYTLMTANLPKLKKLWKPELREYSYGRVKNPLMHFPVLGAQRQYLFRHKRKYDKRTSKEMLEDFKSIIDFLFDKGVWLDQRDQAGYTAVMHASGHSPQPELLEHLLSKGADPDLRSCFGTVPLMEATMHQNMNELDILLKYDADPYEEDNDGVQAYKLAEKLRDVIAVFDRHLKSAIPSKVCSKCAKEGVQRCTKCRVVYYCGKECQADDWPTHKGRCKIVSKSHVRIAISEEKPLIQSSVDLVAAQMHNLMNCDDPAFEPKVLVDLETTPMKDPGDLFKVYTKEWKNKGHLLLKIQAVKITLPESGPLSEYAPNPNQNLLAYNEGKTFGCMLDPKKFDAPKLISVLAEKGVMNIKAYFWAYMEPNKPKELVVITDPIHPAQPW